jgi:hypothetical protein
VCAAHEENKHFSTTLLAFACNKREARDGFWRGAIHLPTLMTPWPVYWYSPRFAKGGVGVGSEFGEGALQVSGKTVG